MTVQKNFRLQLVDYISFHCSIERYLYPKGYADVKVFTHVLFWFSTIINPFIYCLSNEQYRLAYISLYKSITGLPISKEPIYNRTYVSSIRTTGIKISN